MISLITVVIILACIVLAFFILIQAPKGGGLTGNFGSMSSQVMGVKQSTDVMEKGTWSAMGIIAALCIISVLFLEKPPRESAPATPAKEKASSSAPASTQPAVPAGGTTPPPAN